MSLRHLTNALSSTLALSYCAAPSSFLVFLCIFYFCSSTSPSSLFLYTLFPLKHKKEGRGTNVRTETKEPGEDTVVGICAYASVLIFWFVLYCVTLHSSQSVCGCVVPLLVLVCLYFSMSLWADRQA